MIVQQQGLKTVQSGSVAGLGCFTRFELLPERPELPCLVVRQEAEYPLGSFFFALRLGDARFFVLDEHVPRVDLDQVVHQDHSNDLGDVDR